MKVPKETKDIGFYGSGDIGSCNPLYMCAETRTQIFCKSCICS